jgi:sugar O-acyltransferase (sialic acid O-acetyltransferase NeuD family)
MKKIIVLGAGGSGMDILGIIYAINKEKKEWDILGFLDDNLALHGKELDGFKVLGSIDEAINYPDSYFISSIADPTNRIVRRKVWDRVKKYGFRFATLVHPAAIIYKNVCIGEGCVINANCVLGSSVVLENNIHLGYSCNVAHETRIKSHCSFGTGVNFSSGIIVGEDCYIGAGVSATHDVKIDDNILIAVGSAIIDDLKHNSQNIWIGIPAIPIKEYMRNLMNSKHKKA